jgi:hypothetical protein
LYCTALLRIIEDWKKALDENKFIAAILMDLSKAFEYNTILHSNGKKKVVVLSHFESLFSFVKGDNTFLSWIIPNLVREVINFHCW